MNVSRSESGVIMGVQYSIVQYSTAQYTAQRVRTVRYLVVCTDCSLPPPLRAGPCLKYHGLIFNIMLQCDMSYYVMLYSVR